MRKLGPLVLVLSAALLLGACSKSHRGHAVLAGENFSVLNQDTGSIDVYVGAVKIGEVLPNQEIKFDVATGIRSRIEFRESGGPLLYQGDWTFDNHIVLRLTYEKTPGGPNLQVENIEPEDLHVTIDGADIGSVAPGATQTFNVPVGTHELAFRKDSDAFRVAQGDLRFATDNLVDIDYAD